MRIVPARASRSTNPFSRRLNPDDMKRVLEEEEEANLVIFGILQELDSMQLKKVMAGSEEPNVKLAQNLQKFEGPTSQALRELKTAMKNRDFERLLQIVDMS